MPLCNLPVGLIRAVATLEVAEDSVAQEDRREDTKVVTLEVVEDLVGQEDRMEGIKVVEHPDGTHTTGAQETHQVVLIHTQEDLRLHRHHLHLRHQEQEEQRQEEEDRVTKPSSASRTTRSTRMWLISPFG